MNKKLFAFDMDGTIVDSNSNPRPATIEALKEARAKGHLLAIATGRPYSDIVRDLDESLFDFLIANNGAYFYDCKTKEFVYSGELSKEVALEMIEVGSKLNSFYAVHAQGRAERIMLGDSKSFIDTQNDPNYLKFEWKSVEEIKEIIANNPIAQSSLRIDVKSIEEATKYLDAKYGDIAEFQIANTIYLDANPKGISKDVGINAILERTNLSAKDVVAFGDSGNDVRMLKMAGIGVAMGNGNDGSKEAADVVIGSHESDAIADKIRELI